MYINALAGPFCASSGRSSSERNLPEVQRHEMSDDLRFVLSPGLDDRIHPNLYGVTIKRNQEDAVEVRRIGDSATESYFSDPLNLSLTELPGQLREEIYSLTSRVKR